MLKQKLFTLWKLKYDSLVVLLCVHTFPKKTSYPSDTIFLEEIPVPSPVLANTHTSEFSELKAEVDLIKKYTENLNVEIEATKMFINDQFCLLKSSYSEQNVCVSAENTKVIELLQQQNQNLIQENASKNTIKILAEKHTFDNSNSKSAVSEDFTTVNRKKSSRPRKHKKVDLNCSNRYENLYITDSNTESESEDSDDITITDPSTDNNTQPDYTHRIYQRNDDLKEVNKTKSKITEYVNRGNDIRIRNVKQTSTSRLQ